MHRALQALCAGGDVKSLTLAAQKGDLQAGVNFFRANYTLNYLVSRLAYGSLVVPPHFQHSHPAAINPGPNPGAPDHTQAQSDPQHEPRPGAATHALHSATEQATRSQSDPLASSRGASVGGGSTDAAQSGPGIAQVAIMDGITMGGGAGLCLNGAFRVATERCDTVATVLRLRAHADRFNNIECSSCAHSQCSLRDVARRVAVVAMSVLPAFGLVCLAPVVAHARGSLGLPATAPGVRVCVAVVYQRGHRD